MTVRLRSRRGAIGQSWQGRELQEGLEALLGPRIAAAGRRLARADRVSWLDVAPGAARAGVLTDRGEEVTAQLHLAPLGGGDRAVLLDITAGYPELPAQLAAGTFPEEVGRALAEQEIALLPRGVTELWHDCSCGQWPGPCAHVAALAYVLVEAVDERPVHVLTLRGLSLEDVARTAARADDRPPAHLESTAPPTLLEPGDDAGKDAPDDPPEVGEESETLGAPEASFDPRRADAAVLVDPLGLDAARMLARFYGAAEPATDDLPLQ